MATEIVVHSMGAISIPLGNHGTVGGEVEREMDGAAQVASDTHELLEVVLVSLRNTTREEGDRSGDVGTRSLGQKETLGDNCVKWWRCRPP